MTEVEDKKILNDPIVKLILALFTVTGIVSLSKILGFLTLSWSWILYPPAAIIGFVFYIGTHVALLNIFKEKIKEDIRKEIVLALDDNTASTITSINLALMAGNNDG